MPIRFALTAPAAFLALLLALAAPARAQAPAEARDGLPVALFTQRDGPLAAAGNAVANGFSDYFTMVNRRDGGIGGLRIAVRECETGGETARGLACYEEAKAAGAVAVSPWSADTAAALLTRTGADRVPLVAVGNGPPLAARGAVFPFAFAPPATVWDGLGVALAALMEGFGGPEGLRGKRLAYLHRDSPAGREPVRLLEALAADLGVSLRTYALRSVGGDAAADPWRAAKAGAPDYVILDGSAGLPDSPLAEAAAAGIPLNRLVALGGPGEADLRRAGPAARGFREVTWHAVTDSFPAFDQIDLLAIDAGASRTPKEEATGLLYNRGVYNAVVVAEGIRNAQRLTGTARVDGEAVRRGLEAIRLDGARWKELGLTGFAASLTLTCADHSGHQAGFLMEWTGARWVQVSDKLNPLRQRIRPHLDAAVRDFLARYAAEAGRPWPERPDPCDRP